MAGEISRFKMERGTKEYLVANLSKLHGYPSPQKYIALLLEPAGDPIDGSLYYPMSTYETADHLPYGSRYELGKTTCFDDFAVTFTRLVEKQINVGVFVLRNHLIRILPKGECDKIYKDPVYIDGWYKAAND